MVVSIDTYTAVVRFLGWFGGIPVETHTPGCGSHFGIRWVGLDDM